METVILTILLIFSLALIGIVLLQRSEGGGLGMGSGGGGGGGIMSARGTATALTKATWILGIGFFVAAMSLTVISANKAANSSVIGDGEIPQPTAPALPGNLTLPSGTDLAPPVSEPITPPPAD